MRIDGRFSEAQTAMPSLLVSACENLRACRDEVSRKPWASLAWTPAQRNIQSCRCLGAHMTGCGATECAGGCLQSGKLLLQKSL